MYMLRDVDPNHPGWFSSCGLVGPKGDCTPKSSCFYVDALKETLKGMRYMGEVSSGNPKLRIYKFKDIGSSKGAYAVWAASSDNYRVDNYSLQLPAGTDSASLLQLEPGNKDGKSSPLAITNQEVRLAVSVRPGIVLVNHMQ